MSPIRIIAIGMLTAVLAGGLYLSSKGVWGVSNNVVSVRGGSYVGGTGRVK